MSIEAYAKSFAINHHGGQKYGTEPYLVHLEEVVNVARRFGKATPGVVAVCYLHDTIEDTDATKEEIQKNFGSTIASAVEALTNTPSGDPPYSTLVNHPPALTVKLCDRIANVERGGKLEKYKRKHAEFKAKLYKPSSNDSMWKHLDTLLK